LRKGAALGGAVVWVTPVVQTVGMGRAFAQEPSPTPCDPAISFIAMNVTCGGTQYFIKWEADEFKEWEVDPGSVPGCNFTPVGLKMDGDVLGFGVIVDSSGTATVTLGPGCTVQSVAVKGGQICQVLGSYDGTFDVGCPNETTATVTETTTTVPETTTTVPETTTTVPETTKKVPETTTTVPETTTTVPETTTTVPETTTTSD
jgi:hypothetical protein